MIPVGLNKINVNSNVESLTFICSIKVHILYLITYYISISIAIDMDVAIFRQYHVDTIIIEIEKSDYITLKLFRVA